jgi:hypothetical protein
MEQLIIVLILFALSGLSTVIQKWRQRQQQDQSPPSPQPRPLRSQRPQAPPQQPKPVMDWEEQLRRLLEGEPVAPQPSPPPVVETPPAPPPPLPTKAAEPAMIYADTEEAAARSLAPMAESSQAYARASQLHDMAATRLREASDRTDHPLPPIRTAKKKAASPAIASALVQLRQPQTVQQAFVTALILGPPKALAPGET